MELVMQVMQFFVIALVLVIQGSASAAEYSVSPSPATFAEVPSIEVGRPSYHGKSLRSNGPTPESQPNGSVSHPPTALPPLKSASVPQAVEGFAPSFMPSTPTNTTLPPYTSTPPPSIIQRIAPLLPPRTPQINSSHVMAPGSVSHPPTVLPPLKSAPVPEAVKGSVPSLLPSTPTTSSPPHSSAPPPSIVQRTAPLLPRWAPQINSSHAMAPGSVSHPPIVLPPLKSAPVPEAVKEPVPSFLPSTPTSLPSNSSAPPPSIGPRTAPLLPPRTPQINSSHVMAPVPSASPLKELPVSSPTAHSVMPGSLPPSSHQEKAPINSVPNLVPVVSVPVSSPPKRLEQNPPAIPPVMFEAPPPILLVPLASPPVTLPKTPPALHPVMPGEPPSTLPDTAVSPISAPPSSVNGKRYAMPVATPPDKMPTPLPPHPPSKDTAVSPISAPPSSVNGKRYDMPVADPPSKFPSPLSPHPPSKDTAVSPVSARPSSVNGKRYAMPVAAPPNKMPSPLSPHPPSKDTAVSPISAPPSSVNGKRYAMPVAANPDKMPSPLSPHPPSKGYFPVVPPSTHKASRHSNDAPAPAPLFYRKSSLKKRFRAPATSPSSSFHKKYHATNIMSPAPAASHLVPTHAPQQGPPMSLAPLHAPENLPRSRQRHRASPPVSEVSSASPSYSPLSSSANHVPPAPSPSPKAPSGSYKSVPILSPRISPSGSSPKNPKTPPPLPPALALPPPPPNEDCTSVLCIDPLTNTPPGSPCGCVWPMQVGIRLSVPLYTFFPLVSELAEEIASGVFIKQSQVRIMGANAASQDPEKTVVLIDLVPLEAKFDSTTAYLTYQRFWGKQIAIKASFFGDYEVLYVRYPGLPPSPPSAPSSFDSIDGGPNNSRTGKPLGVDVQGRQHKNGINGSVLAIIVLSASIAVVLCSAIAWILMFKCRDRVGKPSSAPQASLPSLARSTGIAGSMIGSGPSSEPLSFGSSIAPYTGSAKTFSSSEIEKATDNFDSSRIIGEGGFGLVYSGVLEDGTKVAVKILKRDDQQGGREFLAEVEMLSRLHHRNLVKLIGICTEEHNRCLVYELIPNGSVESHLHGVDSETSPLDWGTRMKIALGAARGLAYLHEDSSPRVIHRDFKSSNILLELDFTPKVSDFGLARTAMDEENRHISTRVMGTFGYVAPEYAMTGHLLVKSDVYSYGVVLLELLTGRKPVDMSQPPGEENLVAWARPLLTSKEGLQSMVDQSLGSNISFDSVAKVAAIASMCVQPEVSHRPFMGEVVQALKLVCNECDETKEVGSRRSCSQEDLSIDLDSKNDAADSFQLPNTSHSRYIASNYDCYLDVERGLSVSESFDVSVRSERQESGTLRRSSSSGPLRRTGRGRHFWQRIGRLSRGSMSEHGVAFSLWPGSH